jgi:putative membrane protein
MSDPERSTGGAAPAPDGGYTPASVRDGLARLRAEGWNRRLFEATLDRLVREHRFTIAVVFPLTGAAMLVASNEGLLPPPLAYNAALILFGTVVMRLPLIVGVLPVSGRRVGAAVLALTAYAYGIELLGVTTGWPYGAFRYGIDLGPMIAGKVPVGLPVFFLPLVLNAYLLCLLLLGERARNPLLRLGATLAAVLAIDLVLDPAAVAIGFWEYLPLEAAYPYYDVPVSNYFGWVISGTVAVVVFDWGFDREALLARVERCEFTLDDMVSFVVLWGGINLVYLQFVPAVVAAALAVGLVRTDRFDFAVFGGRLARLRE